VNYSELVLTDSHEYESSNNHEKRLQSISVDDRSQSAYNHTYYTQCFI